MGIFSTDKSKLQRVPLWNRDHFESFYGTVFVEIIYSGDRYIWEDGLAFQRVPNLKHKTLWILFRFR